MTRPRKTVLRDKAMNDRMQKSRDAVMGILRPSQKDIEHGLELHADSVVFDTYGFSPRSAIDGDAVRAAVEQGASEFEVAQMAELQSMTRCATDEAARREYLEAWKVSGVTCVFQNAGEEGQSVPRLIQRLARFTYVTDRLRGVVDKAVSADDVLSAHGNGRHCLCLTGNGVPLVERWNSLQEELTFIETFYQLGIRMMHLTYNRRNMIGDGCNEPANAGLSDFGRAVIAEMNRVGVLVDVAHSGWRTSLEAARASTKPIVASHSCCCAVNTHPRGKPDEVIRAIADTGGYVGVCCIPAFLGRSGDIQALLDHIDHIAKTFGPEFVAIGTDTAYCAAANEAEHRKLPDVPRRKHWENFWPENDPLFDPRWNAPHMSQSLAWTNWPLFTVGLVQRGYSDDDIRNILGRNALRVARAVWSPL
jgi:membrane dipeptidase